MKKRPVFGETFGTHWNLFGARLEPHGIQSLYNYSCDLEPVRTRLEPVWNHVEPKIVYTLL